jgi:acyl-CoA synthetase (AMP-forming)/AMP-acid ligase II
LSIVADGLAGVIAARGAKNGDFVAVFMTNSPEMVFVLLALSKIGGIPALINNSLRSPNPLHHQLVLTVVDETLAHCMGVANAKMAISTPDLALHLTQAVDSATNMLSVNFGWFESTETAEGITMDSLPSSHRLESPKRTLQETAMLIYTSGTSGKPKAVAIKNFHVVLVSTTLEIDVENPPENGNQIRIYSCLPLFHATALFTGILYATGVSGALCLSRKFSASSFSKDLYDSKATRMLYVGELCRYLLKAPPSQYDRVHSCVVASGNGLQKDVWEAFQSRFGIHDIREFYRSTEGIAKFDNFSGGRVSIGQCGFTGPVTNFFNQHTYLVRFDLATEKPYRDPNTGFCVIARAGEPGEAIGRVNSLALYHEYLNNPDANSEKLMLDVFAKGDLFQRSGDILVRESSGWVRFVERAGDSFRWQGENVSAGEVREHISRLRGVQDVEVYGAVLERRV